MLVSGELSALQARTTSLEAELSDAHVKLEEAQKLAWHSQAQAESCQNALNIKVMLYRCCAVPMLPRCCAVLMLLHCAVLY